MDKNKSIDGLYSRRSKKSTTTTRKASTSSTKAPSKVKKTSATKTTTSKSPHATAKPAKAYHKNTQPTKQSTDIVASATPTEQSDEQSIPAANVTTDFLAPVQAFNFDDNSNELNPTTTSPKNNQSKKATKPVKEKRKPSKVRRIIVWILFIIIILLIGGVTWLVFWGNDIITKITGGQGNILDLIKIVDNEHYEPLRTDANGRTNILAFGTSGYNMEGENGNGVHDGAQLTDSIMAISFNQKTGDVAMTSLPRDLKASPTCTATGKINEVYWCNNMDGDNEQAGAEALMTEVGSILGIDFQYYAHLNWGSLVQIVDTLNGITITLDEGIYDYYYTGAVFEPGIEYTINGEQALALARARHGTTSGDFSRGASQQKILIGIKDKIFQENLSLPKMMGLASALGDNLRTNFSIDEMKSLAHLTFDFDFDHIRQFSLIEPERLMTTGTINGISYVLPTAGVGNYGNIQNYVAKMLSNDPRTYEDYSILVLNATETPGLASAEQTTLAESGFSNISIDDAPSGEYNDGYTLYSITNTAPGTQKLLEDTYHIEAQPAETVPTELPTGYDFILIVNPASDTTQD